MGKQAKHTTCSTCGKEHYASFAECPFCAPQTQAEPDYDTDEARASYVAIGTQQTWDGRKETSE